MPNPTSYKIYTGDGTTTKFALTGIDGWINDGFIEVYLNETLLTSGYTLIEESGVDKVQFTTAPATGVSVTLKRNTPNTIATFKSDVVDFNDGSVLTAAALDRAVEALVHISQENDDANANALNLNTSQTAWDAENKKITNVSPGTASGDAVTFGQYNVATIYGGSVVNPQVWIITGTGGTTYSLSPAPLNTDSGMFIVENGGNLVDPAAYTISSTQIVFTTGRSGTIHIRNFGVARNIATGSATIEANSLTTAMLQDGSVTTPKIANAAVTNDKVANTSIVATSKLTASGKNKLLATGPAVTIPQPIITLDYTTYSQGLLAAADQSEAGGVLGLGEMAYERSVTNGFIQNAAVTGSKIADGAVGANKLAASSVTETKIADGAVTAAKIPDASIAPVKLTANGPSWDANGTVVGTNPGTSTTGATVQVRLNRAGSVEAKSTSETNLWTGYNSSGTATTTIKAGGTPTVATDLTTKAYVDAAVGTNWSGNLVITNSAGTTWGSGSQIQLTYDLATATVNKLTLVAYVKNNGTASSGNNFTRLSNTSGAGISFSILYSRCNWYGFGGSGAANLDSPTDIVFGRYPISYSGYIPPPESGATMGLFITSGSFYYLKNWQGGNGWGGGAPPDQPNGLSGFGIEWYAWIIRHT
jgi:hypothetical protein